MKGGVIVLRLCTLVLLAGLVCHGRDQQIERKSVSGSLEMTTAVTVEGKELVLRYKVINHDRRDVYLYNRLNDLSPKKTIDRNLIYVHFDPRSKTVLLSKRVERWPGWMSPTVVANPDVTPLRANSTFSEEVRIPIPMRPYDQYRPYDGRAEVKIFSRVRFTLGYRWRLEGTREETVNFSGTQVVYPVWPKDAPADRYDSAALGELKSEDMKLDLPVILPNESDEELDRSHWPH
jgi:hypothetical protein